jgi:hypothetical protein
MNTPKRSDLHIRRIGTLAMDALSTVQTAAILGVTSRGIFLQAAEERMIFLSFEGYRGPLTANLSGDLQPLRSLSPGGTVAVGQGWITFADSDAIISTRDPELWKPPHPVGPPLNSLDRAELIRDLASEVYQHKRAVGLGEMLPTLAGFPPTCVTRDNRFQDTHAKIDDIRGRIAQGDLLPLSATVQSFLGLGSGLTPSGDDFVMGLLLALNRWESILQPGATLSRFNEQVVEAAYRCTTTLSANLIVSAVLGLADERLIQAVDFLAAAEHHQSEVLPGLLTWGNSSGVDALVGMITAFSPI